MDICRNGTRPARLGEAEYFTGTVWRELIVEAPSPARVCSGVARFAPGARTVWHTHPLGQTLYVVSGVGRVQAWGKEIQEIRAGDVIWIPPGEKHWHGATPTTTLVYVAMQEALYGAHVNWMEPVSEDQYNDPT